MLYNPQWWKAGNLQDFIVWFLRGDSGGVSLCQFFLYRLKKMILQKVEKVTDHIISIRQFGQP
jgi:hypothetical protein